jgi:hypothetical protein
MNPLSDRLADYCDPDPRAALVTLVGSAFTLAMLAPIADLANPYHLFGAAGTAFAFLVSVAVLADCRRRRRTSGD